jgi:hypothetical protein
MQYINETNGQCQVYSSRRRVCGWGLQLCGHGDISYHSHGDNLLLWRWRMVPLTQSWGLAKALCLDMYRAPMVSQSMAVLGLPCRQCYLSVRAPGTVHACSMVPPSKPDERRCPCH